MRHTELGKTELAHGPEKGTMPVKTSDEIRTMCHARTTWSIAKNLSGCSRPRDDVRLGRHRIALKKRRLRKDNLALRRRVRQMENLLEMEAS